MLFLELAVNCQCTSELRSCRPTEIRSYGAVELWSCVVADLWSCGPAKLRICGAAKLWSYWLADLRSCGPTDLRSCGSADLRSSIRQKIKVLNFENGFWVFLRWGCRSFFVYAPCPFLMIYALFIANYFHKLALLLFQSKISWHLCWISSLIVAWDAEHILLHVSNLCIFNLYLLSTCRILPGEKLIFSSSFQWRKLF